MRRGIATAFVLGAAAVAAGCHGPRILEYDGGAGTAGGAGAGGSGATAGSGGGSSGATGGSGGSPSGSGGSAGVAGAAGAAGRGGAGGAGGGACAPQMQPQMFHRGSYGPSVSDTTTSRYYWVEQTAPRISIHYSAGDPPAHVKHMFEFDTGGAPPWKVAIGDQLVAVMWQIDSRLALYGPDATSAQIGATMTLGRGYGVTVDDGTVFYSHDPVGGNPTPGVYRWSPPAAPQLFASYATLGGTWTIAHIMRATPNKLLFSDTTDVRIIDRINGGAAQMVFDNPGNRTVVDIKPARPRTVEVSVLVSLDDATYFETGRDYYVDLTRPGTAPIDLASATTALANTTSACGAAARYRGAGVLYRQRYIYEGQGGLFAVDVDFGGAVSNLVRLTGIPLRYIEVTADGDLFAGWVFSGTQWDYYRVGRI